MYCTFCFNKIYYIINPKILITIKCAIRYTNNRTKECTISRGAATVVGTGGGGVSPPL